MSTRFVNIDNDSPMLGLLIYCPATGTFSSGRIETLTYENVAVRFLSPPMIPMDDVKNWPPRVYCG